MHPESDGTAWVHGSSLAQVVLHQVPEETRLAVLVSTAFLTQSLAKSERQEEFNLWVTESRNKEHGGTYEWTKSMFALKKMVKNQVTENATS